MVLTGDGWPTDRWVAPAILFGAACHWMILCLLCHLYLALLVNYTMILRYVGVGVNYLGESFRNSL